MPKSMDNEFEEIKEEYVYTVEGQSIVIEKSRRNELGYVFRMLRISTGMNRKDFAEWLCIPYRTMTEWERGTRQMPDYVFRLIAYKVMSERKKGRI